METNIDIEETSIEWLVTQLPTIDFTDPYYKKILKKAKKLEKNNIDNKVIHFAEWLTKKHPLVLINLYNHFNEEYDNYL